MSPSTLVAMLMVLVASASVSMANMGESQKPNMPHVFQNEKQLSQYLQALDDYYLLLGKPRFVVVAFGTGRISERSLLDI